MWLRLCLGVVIISYPAQSRIFPLLKFNKIFKLSLANNCIIHIVSTLLIHMSSMINTSGSESKEACMAVINIIVQFGRDFILLNAS